MKTLGRSALVVCLLVVAASATPPRAQTCDAPPLFDLGGPVCGASRLGVQCGCSECLTWDPATNATWYEIRRCEASGANCTIVGNTRAKNRAGIIARLWCAPWDSPFPVEDMAYDYTVRACTDGASGPNCGTNVSAPVRYVAAPYMCIQAGVEVACSSIAPPSPSSLSDADGDGITDAMDADDDGDGVADARDNCPLAKNIGQRNADLDGAGDACDPHPLATGDIADADGDGIADAVDLCRQTYDPGQADADRDRTGDACDDCPAAFDPTQSDLDADGEGDRCDHDDGTIDAAWVSRVRLSWEPESGYAKWCVYRGDLALLRQSGSYTQAPGSGPLAGRFCSLTALVLDDATPPAPSRTAFYLVSGRSGTFEGDLGTDSSGRARPNSNPCP